MSTNRTGFRSAHPASALLFFVFAFTVSMASTHPLLLAACFGSAAVCDTALQGRKALRLLLRVLLPMLALITAFNGFYNHYGVTVLFTMPGGNRFTLEALLYGLVFAVKACSAILWLDLMGEVMQSEKVIFLFGRFSPRLALVISMALRFLPLIRRQASVINGAQRGVGAGVTGNLFQKIRAAAHRLSILVSWTLERGVDTADSMRARGYGLRHRSFYNHFAFSPADAWLTAVTGVAFTLYLVTVKSLGAVYNPVVTVPAPTVLGWIAYGALLAALLWPALSELLSLRRFSDAKKEAARMMNTNEEVTI